MYFYYVFNIYFTNISDENKKFVALNINSYYYIFINSNNKNHNIYIYIYFIYIISNLKN
jgi:hypothetical protein